jgi:hypothetical protein
MLGFTKPVSFLSSLVSLISLSFSLSCGYQPLYATPSGEAFHVALVKSAVGSLMVAEEVVRGARDALAREGSLAPGDGFPRLEIEVVRVDETSEGIVSTPSATVPGGVPQARASELGVVARAWVVRRPDGPHELDTGDLRVEGLEGAPLGNAGAEVWQREDSLRAVARQLGGRIALHTLGHPIVTVSAE